jgi:hypothetical protein
MKRDYRFDDFNQEFTSVISWFLNNAALLVIEFDPILILGFISFK